ncbi:hypothetical protein HII31_09897 [Pseudocercospora fuligena]|uniref:Uncharacterized protein n=1 Tax=Pseudocercospora fuligena TaxID=685502 RepID=A0A8H6RDL1_9PEZI|nr:hypothetical protein HII31_09897 [Pseudocercospora fuligena]
MPLPTFGDITEAAGGLAGLIIVYIIYEAVHLIYVSVGHHSEDLSYNEKLIIAANIAVAWHLIKRRIYVELGEAEEEDLQPLAGNVILDLVIQHAGWIALGMLGCVIRSFMS